MDPVIKTLIIKRFRSTPSEVVSLDNPTFLVGRNGSGKSNVADAFAFIAEAMVSPLQAVFNSRGGISTVRNRTSGQGYPPNLGLGVEFGRLSGFRVQPDIAHGRYAFEIGALPNRGFEVLREQCVVYTEDSRKYWFDRQKKKLESNIDILKEVRGRFLTPSSLSIPLLGGVEPFLPVQQSLRSMHVYSIDPAKLRDMQEPDVGEVLRSDGSNATSVLDEVARRSEEDTNRIGEILASIVPCTTQVRSKKHGKKLSFEFTQEWGGKKRLNFEAFVMSDGTLRALGLLLAVYQKPHPSLVVIEEPEASMHPGAVAAVLDLLKYAASFMQVVVTTHSPEVLDAKWIEDRHLRVVSWKEGATQVSEPPEPARRALHQHLMGAGELFRSNALEAVPLFEHVSEQLSLFEDVRDL